MDYVKQLETRNEELIDKCKNLEYKNIFLENYIQNNQPGKIVEFLFCCNSQVKSIYNIHYLGKHGDHDYVDDNFKYVSFKKFIINEVIHFLNLYSDVDEIIIRLNKVKSYEKINIWELIYFKKSNSKWTLIDIIKYPLYAYSIKNSKEFLWEEVHD